MHAIAPRIVTLTTDFGVGSAYVAEMKGRLLHAAAPFTIVDIAHDIPAHDIHSAAWLVAHTCPSFPTGTLHVIVVDPGVGTARRILWVRAGGQAFLCPDNGVLSRILDTSEAEAIHEVTVPLNASTTFHGRDVLAPAAAALIDGAAPESLGPAYEALVTLHVPEPRETAGGIEGEIVHVDSFGNLLTNLPATLWPRLVASGRLLVGDRTITQVVRTYAEAPAGTPVALVGSQGVIEAAIVQGRASNSLAASIGTRVVLP